MHKKMDFDTHPELLILPYKHGIQLVNPENHSKQTTSLRILNLYNSPLAVYFYNSDNIFIDGNNGSVEIAGATSIQDIRGRKIEKFIGKELAGMVLKNNQNVIQSKSMTLLEESGKRTDKNNISVISFKFPLYQKNKIIGLMGCSIKTDSYAPGQISPMFLSLLTTGLLNAPLPSQTHFKSTHNIHLTARETDIIKQLIRGKTAKEIGKILDISNRTVEDRLASLKLKTNCKTKSALIDRFIDEFYN